ncbi:MAG: hypothetical protein HZA15_02500 [Nitrospirae bacterium]|nr:hypothetical protein [Nitrospirota bacterium]
MKNCRPFELRCTGHDAKLISASNFIEGQGMLKRLIVAAAMIVALLLSFMPDGSFAEGSISEYKRLADLALPGRPVRASVDATGNIYAVEAGRPYLAKYSAFGEFLGSMPLSSVPTAIKVAADGLLYVGLKDKIEIYNGTTLLRTITGISHPVSIDVAISGAMYVVDLKHYCVKIVSPSGDITVVGDYKVFGSDLRDLVIDEPNNELYVLDRNEPASDLYVWRVQTFDLSGNFLRSFSHYGYAAEGTLISASSLIVDEQRRVYVADNVQNIIGVFDHTGNHLGSLYDAANPYYNPVEMEYRNNRLYFLSFLGNRVTVLGLAGYADLAVLPGKVDLEVQGPYLKGEKAITISNTGSGNLQWSAASDADWLALSKTSGSIGGGLQDQAEIAVNTSGLLPGRHTGKITFAFNGGVSYLGVTVDVLPPPVLTVSPAGMELQAEAGAAVSAQATIELSNDLSGSLVWTASSDREWLSISPATGRSHELTPAIVTVNTAGLVPGIYTGRISITSDGMPGSPSEISIKLVVVATNMIQVATNNENAVFSISGPQSFSGSGSSWSASNIADGAYTITYGEVSGLKTPMPETKTVAGGNTITFTGNYEEMRPASIVVTLGGSNDATNVKLMDLHGIVNEFVAFKKMRGGVVTAAGDLDGDGMIEIAATIHHGRSRVGVFDQSGRPLAAFSAFPGNGTYDISTADLDNDGAAELIVSKSSGTPEIRVLSFNKGSVTDTGIHLTPYGDTEFSSLLVGAGDIDGDGSREVVTVLASGKTILIRVWEPEMSAGPGAWTVSLKKEVCLEVKPRTILRGLALKATGNSAADDIMIMRHDGSMIMVGPDNIVREVSLAAAYGVSDMSAEDVNGDGQIEIITGLKDGTVKVFALDGTELKSIKAFRTNSGARVAGIPEGVDR